MVTSHNRAARRIAKRYGGRYRPQVSPDVKAPCKRIEVKSSASEIQQALRQLAGGPCDAYIALPTPEHQKAQRRLKGLKTGLMNYRGDIVKPSTRKKK